MAILIDLSVSIDCTPRPEPPMMIPSFEYHGNEEGARQMRLFFPGLETARELPTGAGWALEKTGTGIRAGEPAEPWHYHPTMDCGKVPFRVDETPLEWYIGRGIKLDFRAFPDGYRATPRDLVNSFEELQYEPSNGDIILVNTGADAWWGRPEFLHKGCGIGRDATLWLADRDVRVMGTDAWSWHGRLNGAAGATGDPGETTPEDGYDEGIERGYCHIEKLTNLDRLPPLGFTFFCYPVRMKGANAGWVRALALIDDADAK